MHTYHTIITDLETGELFHYVGKHKGTNPRYKGSGACIAFFQNYNRRIRQRFVLETIILKLVDDYQMLRYHENILIIEASKQFGSKCLNVAGNGKASSSCFYKELVKCITDDEIYEVSDGSLKTATQKYISEQLVIEEKRKKDKEEKEKRKKELAQKRADERNELLNFSDDKSVTYSEKYLDFYDSILDYARKNRKITNAQIKCLEPAHVKYMEYLQSIGCIRITSGTILTTDWNAMKKKFPKLPPYAAEPTKSTKENLPESITKTDLEFLRVLGGEQYQKYHQACLEGLIKII